MMTEHSVATPDVEERAPASYRVRALAGVIDALIMFAIVFAIVLVWLFTVGIVEVYPYDDREPLLTLMELSYPASIALYTMITGTLGRTVGMRILGLRILTSDGEVPTRLRLLGRAVVLTAVVCAMYWLILRETFPNPLGALVPLAYSLWMLANRRRQLPHDQLLRTVVVRRQAPVPSPEVLVAVRSQYGELPAPEAKVLLGDLDKLRLRTRRAMHLASLPMFVLALIAWGAAAVVLNKFEIGALFAVNVYWIAAGPVGLAVTAWWFHRQQRRGGAAPLRAPTIIAIVVALASPLILLLAFGGLLIGAGFFAVAIAARSKALGAAAVLFAVVTTVDLLAVVATVTIPGDLSTDPGSALIFALLGLVLTVAAAVTYWRERTSA